MRLRAAQRRVPPPLRCRGNAALSGSAWFSPPLRYGENQALETDALRAPLSAALGVEVNVLGNDSATFKEPSFTDLKNQFIDF